MSASRNPAADWPEPADSNNAAWLAQVAPAGWRNPAPASRYNLVVIGGGTAGLVTAVAAAGLGARVALVERHRLGGDCLNTGCVPSKTLLRSARAAAAVREAARFGVRVPQGVEIDFAAVMERMRAVRAAISPHDSAQRLRGLGVDVFFGAARFAASDELEVAGARLRFRRAVIATGARFAPPGLRGLESVRYLTHESVWSLTEQPKRLAVLGGGPIGCELSQAFARLGTRVTLFHPHPELLNKEDADAAALVRASLQTDGVDIRLGARVASVRSGESGSVVLDGEPEPFDALLVATGRKPNLENLGLEAAGVHLTPEGRLVVNDRLQTSNPRIFAAGDVCLHDQFTHAADFSARLVVQNALFFGRKRASSLLVPRATYTDPELASVGLTQAAVRERGIEVDVFQRSLAEVDRACTDDEGAGFVRLVVAAGTDRILGATIVGPHAGDLISEITLAMASGTGLGRIASVIHPYPTLAEAIRQCGDQYNRTRLTPTVKAWMERWFRWQR
jgi:pyruvate/2-oxoglutarate dehydrogenase complex dihydrolipoamide dehydrogenase (E3) component